jgi:hypothetical protein
MSDVVVTVPKTFQYGGFRGLKAWCAEGDCAGEAQDSGELWDYSTWGVRPDIRPGERVYIVCEDRLRGYAPLVELDFIERRPGQGYVVLLRKGGAVAVTIPDRITGFRGWRYRWWKREDEIPFPDWRTTDVQKQPRKRRATNDRQLSLL